MKTVKLTEQELIAVSDSLYTQLEVLKEDFIKKSGAYTNTAYADEVKVEIKSLKSAIKKINKLLK